MEKKFTVSAKIKGVIMEIHTKGISWMYLNKKKMPLLDTAKRPRDDALVDEYNINDRAMILKIGRFFDREPRAVLFSFF